LASSIALEDLPESLNSIQRWDRVGIATREPHEFDPREFI
jgi:hypothetical protein